MSDFGMTGFMNKISDQVSGPMIIATLFPVVLFLVMLVLVVLPVTPYGHEYADLLKTPQNWTGIGAVVAALIILLSTILLYQLNSPLIRLYEGYPWSKSWLGRFLCWRQKNHWNHARAMKDRIFNWTDNINLEDLSDEDYAKLGDDLYRIRDKYQKTLINEYPHAQEFILPTRLGNLIRAFETYTSRQYKADVIAIWPRMQGVLDPNMAQGLDGVKVGVDFMLNVSFLSAVLAVLLAAAGIHWRHPWYYGWWQPWEGWTVLLAALSWLAYEGAINRAGEWGLAVKAAFDLYRLPLLQKLGYQVTPSNLTEERMAWQVLSYQFTYPGDGLCRDLPYSKPQVTLIPEPACAKLTLARTISSVDETASEVRIVISNLDPTRAGVDAVAVRDEVPSGFVYIANSAAVGGAPVELLGVNPLHVQLGRLPYNESRVLTYRVKSQPAKS